MVCRLIEQKQIRAGKQQLCQLQLGLLSAAQHADRHGGLFIIKPQAQQRRAGTGAAGKAAFAQKAVIEQHLALDQLGLVLRFPLQSQVDLFQLALHPEQGSEYAEHLGVSGLLQIVTHVLLHIADHSVPRKVDFAPVVRQIARQHLKQGGFSGTVDPHKANSVAGLYFKGNAAEQILSAECLS